MCLIVEDYLLFLIKDLVINKNKVEDEIIQLNN